MHIFQRSLILSVSLTLSWAANLHAESRFDVAFANHCRSFENFAERQEWWSSQYGSQVTIGALLSGKGIDPVLRLGQLLLMKQTLLEQQKLNSQNLMVLDLETLGVIEESYARGDSALTELGGAVAGNIDLSEDGILKARICAFECVDENGFLQKQEFERCLK